MRLENQLAPVDACRRLKELGIVQEGKFTWLYNCATKSHELSMYEVEAVEILAKSSPRDNHWKERIENGIYSAFSVAELGVLLPDVYAEMQWVSIPNAGYNSKNINMEPPNCYSIHIGEDMNHLDHEAFDQELYPTEAQARAAYLIHLLENKLVTPEECNNRLTES